MSYLMLTVLLHMWSGSQVAPQGPHHRQHGFQCSLNDL